MRLLAELKRGQRREEYTDGEHRMHGSVDVFESKCKEEGEWWVPAIVQQTVQLEFWVVVNMFESTCKEREGGMVGAGHSVADGRA